MRFSTFLLLFLFIFSFGTAASAQNLIYDWSVEEYETCPTGLALTLFVPHWLSFRGNPDYFNTCSPNLGPLTNPFGWQHPRTGEALMGVVTYSSGLTNAREYPGVELLEPLVVGESYDISYYAAAAYSPNASGRATNNLGILLMTENYLTTDELGVIPNFAHFNVDTIVADTSNWVYIGGTIMADSAYKYVAFGNFFDDQNTEVISMDPDDPDPSNLAYYYFDDFCVAPEGGVCESSLSIHKIEPQIRINLFPNPTSGTVKIQSSKPVTAFSLFNANGKLVLNESTSMNSVGDTYQVDLSSYQAGLYILEVQTEEGIARKKLVINL